MSNWFATWFDTEFYHKLYNNRDESEAQRFIQNILALLKLPNRSKILDVACGKGRHAKAIADAGYDAVGTDLSPNSIADANKIANENLHFFVQDMRETFRQNEFDAVFNLFTSFGYFETENDNILAAKAMALNVKPGGVLLIDFVNQAHALSNIAAKPNEVQTRGNLHFDIERLYENERYIKNITVCTEDKCHRFQESLQALCKEDFLRYFSPHGMELENTFGDYDLNAYDAVSSPRMILLFRKK